MLSRLLNVLQKLLLLHCQYISICNNKLLLLLLLLPLYLLLPMRRHLYPVNSKYHYHLNLMVLRPNWVIGHSRLISFVILVVLLVVYSVSNLQQGYWLVRWLHGGALSVIEQIRLVIICWKPGIWMIYWTTWKQPSVMWTMWTSCITS